MGRKSIIKVMTTFTNFGLGIIVSRDYEDSDEHFMISLYLGIVCIEINFVHKGEDNNWLSFEYI